MSQEVKNYKIIKYFLSISALTQDRVQYPGYRKHYNSTLFSRHRTRKPQTGGVKKRNRYSSSYLLALTEGPYLDNQRSTDRVATSTTIVDTGTIDDIKYNVEKQYTQNRVDNISTNKSNETLTDLQLQTNNTKNKDMVARFKQYDEAVSKLEFLQRNKAEKNILEKHGMTLYPTPLSAKGYKTSTSVTNLKQKTAENNLPNSEDSEYDDVAVSITSAYINSDDKITDNKKMLTISGLDLMAVLSQLRAENRNYSLQILV